MIKGVCVCVVFTVVYRKVYALFLPIARKIKFPFAVFALRCLVMKCSYYCCNFKPSIYTGDLCKFVMMFFAVAFVLQCLTPHARRPAPSIVSQKAGGNDALALLLTVTTNLLGVVTVPFFVQLVVQAGEDASIDPVSLLVKLVRKGREVFKSLMYTNLIQYTYAGDWATNL